MTSPVFTPLQMFYSTSGLPLTDGYIYIGTASQNPQTNPIAVYWDAAGTIPAAQPIRTSGGYPVRNGSPATVFVLAKDFSLIVRDKSSSLVFSRLSGNAFSAEWVTYTPAGTGAVATTAQAKLRESVSVLDFGAVGNGVTDDTVKIQAAINALLGLGGGDLILPRGIYAHGDLTVNWTNAPIRFMGEQYNAQSGFGTEMLYTGSGTAITFNGNGAPYNGYTIENLKIRAASSGNTWAIKFNKCAHLHVRHAYLKGFGSASGGGIYCTGLNDSIDQTEWVDIDDVFFDGCYNGIYSDNTDANAFNIYACFFADMGGVSIRGDNGGGAHVFGFQRWNIEGNRFYSSTTSNFISIAGGGRGLSVDGNYFENNSQRCACLYVNGALKSTAVSFTNNNVNVDPAVNGGVVEVGYCDGLTVRDNTFLPATAGSTSMVQLLTASPFGVDGYVVQKPGIPLGSSITRTLRDNAGTTYVDDVVSNFVYERHVAGVFTSGRFSATQNPSTDWAVKPYEFGVVGIAPSGTYDVATGSGLLVVHSDTSGGAAVFLCYGAASAVKLGGDAAIVSGAPAAGQIGVYYNAGTGKYRIENKAAFTHFVYLTLIQTRPVS